MDNNTYQYELLKSIENIANKLDPDAPKSEKETFQYRMLEAIQRISNGTANNYYIAYIDKSTGATEGDTIFYNSNHSIVSSKEIYDRFVAEVPPTINVVCNNNGVITTNSRSVMSAYKNSNTGDWQITISTNFDGEPEISLNKTGSSWEDTEG